MRFLRVEWRYDQVIAVFQIDNPMALFDHCGKVVWNRIERWNKRSLQVRIDNLRNLGEPVLEEMKGVTAIDKMVASMEEE